MSRYRMFHRFGQASIGYGGLVSDSSRFFEQMFQKLLLLFSVTIVINTATLTIFEPKSQLY
jgi:hypothetical protein